MHTNYGFTDTSITHVIGIDEVGWGAIAGPLYVGGCVVRVDDNLEWLTVKDSKKYTTERSREVAYANIQRWQSEGRIEYFYWSCEAPEVAAGPAAALIKSQHLCVSALIGCGEGPDKRAGVMVDGKTPIRGLPPEIEVLALPKADAIFKVVSAASVVAKVERDRWMHTMSEHHRDYRFEANKGYPTQEHLVLLDEYGPCAEHRGNVNRIRKMRAEAERLHKTYAR